jgi:hypothetical protein
MLRKRTVIALGLSYNNLTINILKVWYIIDVIVP